MLLKSDFTLGGLAAMGATLFTNPLEVIKVRMQLQGELAKRGTYVEPYKSVQGAFITIVKNEGPLAFQKGLAPALCFQFIINSLRLGIYATAMKKGWATNKSKEISPLRVSFWGGIGGVCGSFCSSPFFMIKTQLQAQANENIAVGHQHNHMSMLHAFKRIYARNGFLGLWNGATTNMIRAFFSSGAQIAAFDWTKAKLRDNGLATHTSLNSFCGGLLSGSVLAAVVTPPDVITIRLYNQPIDKQGRGLIYRGGLDCFVKILKTEGISGFFKGFWPTYMRFAPHSTISLLLFDKLRALRDEYK